MKYLSLQSTSRGIYPFTIAALCLVLAVSAFFHGNARAAGITLAWDAEKGAAGYKIYYGTESDAYTTSVDVGNVTTYLLTLTDGRTYYLAATAYDSGKLESNFSNEISYSAGITSCSYALSATSASVDASGGSGSVTVTTQTGCSWSASSAASWVTIGAGAGGTGSGTVAYTVDANTDVSRTASSTIAGKAFTISQSGASSASARTGDPVSPSDNVSDTRGSRKSAAGARGKTLHHGQQPHIPPHKDTSLIRATDPDQEYRKRHTSFQRPALNPTPLSTDSSGSAVKTDTHAPAGKAHFVPYKIEQKRE
jgi:hypothetical protein